MNMHTASSHSMHRQNYDDNDDDDDYDKISVRIYKYKENKTSVLLLNPHLQYKQNINLYN